jgi:carbon monoxide dehydrogenase subunit G
MKFSGDLTVKAPREAVFDRFKDAPFFASCLEGVNDLKELTPTQYTAIFQTKIAYIRFKFEVTVEMIRAERPELIEAKIEGKPHGIVGRLSATSKATFTENSGETVIHYDVEASLTGKLGSIGQPVLKSKAKEMERQFVANLRAAFPSGVAEAAS